MNSNGISLRYLFCGDLLITYMRNLIKPKVRDE